MIQYDSITMLYSIMIKIPNQRNFQDFSYSDSLQKKLENLSFNSVFEVRNKNVQKSKSQKQKPLHKKVVINLTKDQIKNQSCNSQTNVLQSNLMLQQNTQDKNKIKTKNLFTSKKQNISENFHLKKVIKNHKVAKISENFIKKLKRNSIYRQPSIFQPFIQNQGKFNDSLQGIVIPPYIFYPFLCFSSLFTLFFCFLVTLQLIFTPIVHSEALTYIQIYGIIWIIIEIIVNFIKVTYSDGQNIRQLKKIAKIYIRKKFWVDALSFLSLALNLIIDPQFSFYFGLAFFFKLPDCFLKISKLQNKIINSFYKEQYWNLMKLIFRNFFLAHVIALCLIEMTWLNSEDNWMLVKNIQNVEWYEQYIWSYYWATTIMLTVGFGDISASNYQEAICLIFIETISCMALAYNINCVGTLISELRQRSAQKDKSLKVLRNMSQKNKIHGDIEFKLKNYIEQSFETKVKQNFEKQKELVTKLPENLKAEYLRSANSDIFANIMFFKSFTQKTIHKVAQKIEASLYHPGEKFTFLNFSAYILKEGKVGYFPNFQISSKVNKIPIDQILADERTSAKLISLEFLSDNCLIKNFQVKSIGYSVIFRIAINEFKQLIKTKAVDYEHFFAIRDRQKFFTDQLEIIPCNYCGKNVFHTKFRCPKLHFMPLKQIVIGKYLQCEKKSVNFRRPYIRQKHAYHPYLGWKLNFTEKNLFIENLTDNFSMNKQIDFQFQVSNNVNNRKSFYQTRKHRQQFGKTRLILNAAEQMKKQMENLLCHEQQSNFWEIQADFAKDYVYYFRDYNPRRLSNTNFKKNKSASRKRSMSRSNFCGKF